MVDIIFANSCDLILELRKEDYIEESIANLAHQLAIPKEDLFLINIKGEVCENDGRLQDYLSGCKRSTLVLVQKKFINTDIFLDQLEINSFEVYPVEFQNYERWDPDELEVDLDDGGIILENLETIKTSEDILFEICDVIKKKYVEYNYKKENLINNIRIIMNRKLVLKALIKMCTYYKNVIESSYEMLQDEFHRIRSDEMNMKDYSNRMSSDSFFRKSVVKMGEILGHIEQKYLNSLKNLYKELNDEVENMNQIFSRLKDNKSKLMKLRQNIENHIGETEFPVSRILLKTNQEYLKFLEGIFKLNDFSYHPKTPIAEDLKNFTKYYNFHRLVDEINPYIDLLNEFEKQIPTFNNRIDTVCKNLMSMISIFVNKFNYLAKKKINLLWRKISKAAKMVEALYALRVNPENEIKLNDGWVCRPGVIEIGIKSKILKETENLNVEQMRFVESYGNLLPAQFVKGLLRMMNFKEIDKQAGEIANQPLISQISNLSTDEIVQYYREQIYTIDKYYQSEIQQKKTMISDLNNEIQEINEKIEDILQEKLKNEVKLVDVYEEKSMYGAKDRGMQPSEEITKNLVFLKSKFLRFKYAAYATRKMDIINSLRESNKKYMNPFRTPG